VARLEGYPPSASLVASYAWVISRTSANRPSFEEVTLRDHINQGVIDQLRGAVALHRDFRRRNTEDQPLFTLANRLIWASSPRICAEGATPGSVRCSQPMMERQALPCIKVGSRRSSRGRSGRTWA
jgi:hypothetical protein